MRIAVAVKQVPAASECSTDMERGFVIRSGRRRLNPYDRPAIEAALRLRDLSGGSVDVFSMGPASASEVVAEAMSMGADNGFLLTDKVFSGADSLVTALTLAEAFKLLGPYDLYICGQKTTDGDTGQVGPSLAAILGLPFVGRVESIDGSNEARLSLSQSTGFERQLVKAEGPLVISVRRSGFTPRLPSLKMKIKKKYIRELTFANFHGLKPSQLGSLGSPTKIERIYLPEQTPTGQVNRMNGQEAALAIWSIFKERCDV